MLTNADMGLAEVRAFSRSTPRASGSCKQPCAGCTARRAYHRVLKLARTIADLAGAPEIGPVHQAETIQYRPRRVG